MKTKTVKNYPYATPMGTVIIEGKSVFEKNDNGEVFVPGLLIEKWNHLILKKLALKKSTFTAQELQFIFSVMPFSQNELAQLMGKDRSTLTKYKNGENPIDPMFADLLQQIVGDHLNGNTKTIDRLKERLASKDQDQSIDRIKVS